MRVGRKFLSSKSVGVLMALALAASACGGGSGGTTVTAAAADGPESFEDLEFNSPIGDFLGFEGFGGEDDNERFAEMEREAGRLTAACMLEKGFEYTPPDTSDFASFGPGGDDIPYFSDEWVDKYGFGISTQRFPQSSVGDLVGYPDEEFNGPGEDFVDPNDEYVSSLSEGEREAYQEALWGQPPDFGPEGPAEDFVFEPTGCQNESFDAAFNSGLGGNIDAFFETFGDELQALEERANADPEAIAFNNRVSDCVTEAGMSWIDQEDLYQRFESRLSAIEPSAFRGGGDPFEAAGVDPEEMTERELDDFFRDMNRLDPADLGTLADIQSEEIALARVVIDCGGGPLNEQFVLGEIRAKYEQEFLDSNADALAELKSGE